MYEWKGLKKVYAHIIRHIENELADWCRDFSEIETPILIKYIKTEVTVKYGQSIDSKRDVKKDEVLYFCSAYQRTRGSQEPVIAHLVFNLTSKVDRKWGCYT